MTDNSTRGDGEYSKQGDGQIPPEGKSESTDPNMHPVRPWRESSPASGAPTFGPSSQFGAPDFASVFADTARRIDHLREVLIQDGGSPVANQIFVNEAGQVAGDVERYLGVDPVQLAKANALQVEAVARARQIDAATLRDFIAMLNQLNFDMALSAQRIRVAQMAQELEVQGAEQLLARGEMTKARFDITRARAEIEAGVERDLLPREEKVIRRDAEMRLRARFRNLHRTKIRVATFVTAALIPISQLVCNQPEYADVPVLNVINGATDAVFEPIFSGVVYSITGDAAGAPNMERTPVSAASGRSSDAHVSLT